MSSAKKLQQRVSSVSDKLLAIQEEIGSYAINPHDLHSSIFHCMVLMNKCSLTQKELDDISNKFKEISTERELTQSEIMTCRIIEQDYLILLNSLETLNGISESFNAAQSGRKKADAIKNAAEVLDFQSALSNEKEECRRKQNEK